jgi:hypothetical protein
MHINNFAGALTAFEFSCSTSDIIRDAFNIDATNVRLSRAALSQMPELAARMCAT